MVDEECTYAKLYVEYMPCPPGLYMFFVSFFVPKAGVKLEFHRGNRLGPMPPDASGFPGGIPAYVKTDLSRQPAGHRHHHL